jgi:hypothetical protein
VRLQPGKLQLEDVEVFVAEPLPMAVEQVTEYNFGVAGVIALGARRHVCAQRLAFGTAEPRCQREEGEQRTVSGPSKQAVSRVT